MDRRLTGGARWRAVGQLAATLLAALSASCETPTAGVVVDVITDLRPGFEFVAVRTELVARGATRSTRYTVTGAEDFFAGSRVAELDASGPDDAAQVEVSLLGPGGAVLVRRPVRVAMRGLVAVTVVIGRTCLGVECGVGEACFAGACVPDDCRRETPEACGEGMCVDAADCARPTECSTAQCVDGACLVRQIACTDAGAGDAGMEDAGLCGTSCTTTCGSRGAFLCDMAGNPTDCGTPDEECNTRDDDCDGATDEGFDPERVLVRAFQLPGGSSVCQSPFSLECRAAFHEHCATRGCANTGYGATFLERVGLDDLVSGFCLSAALEATSYAELQAFDPDCSASTRGNIECAGAVARLCVARGHATGFYLLPGDVLTAACYESSAVAIETARYSEVATYQASCDARPFFEGARCNRAFASFCQDRGYQTGMGPVSMSGGIDPQVTFLCVR